MGNHHLPNIILIVCDTLGAKHMSLSGYGRRTTPFIERMIEDGGFAFYNRCFSPASWTVPSHVSLFTGLYPDEHGVGDENFSLPDNLYCLAEILKYLQYTTFGVTSNGLVSGLLNFNKGFDEFYEMWHLFNSREFFEINQAFSRSKKHVKGELARFRLLLQLSSPQGAHTFLLKKMIDGIFNKIHGLQVILKKSVYATQRTIDTAKKIINSQDAQSPFFLFLNIIEMHNQYNPPSGITAFEKIGPKTRRTVLKKFEWHHYTLSPFSQETFEILNILYDREVLFLDSVLWDFYSFLKDKRILENTLIIITSDHGEFLGEHGQVNHLFTLYNELLHVPLIIKFPQDFALKGQKDDLVQLHDIFATITDIAGSPLPVPGSSHSLLSSDRRKIAYSQLLSCGRWLNKLRQKNPSFVSQDFMQPQRALITDNMLKIIKRADGFTEIFDLNKDLYETQSLSNEPSYKEQKSKLMQLLDEAH
jgi:arylsulfatase A-like enzyme